MESIKSLAKWIIFLFSSAPQFINLRISSISIRTYPIIARCQISDGFCKNKGCIVQNNFQQSKPKLIDNAIIKVIKSSVQKSKQQQAMVIIVEGYEVIYLNIKKMIGNPIPYDEYCKNGKNNMNGDNLILKEYIIKNGNKNAPKEFQIDEFLDDTKQQCDNSKYNSNTNQQNNVKKNQNINQNSNKTTTNLQQSKLNLAPKNQPKVVKQQQKVINKNQNPIKPNPNPNPNLNIKMQSNNNPKPKYQPIQKVERKQFKSSEPIRMQAKKPNHQYNEIKGLFVGMDNWTILVRILFIHPIKTIMTKKGTESTILIMQVGDASGCIQCTAFGQNAQKLEGTLKQDNIYEISGGAIIQSSFMGKHQMKITFGQLTKINLKEDDASIPYIEDFCLTVKKLAQAPIGQQVKVICLVKDNNQVQDIISKAGKQLKKKSVELVDPQEKIQVQALIWGQRGYQKFQKYPYVIKGIQINQYNNVRQYTIKQAYIARVLKQHNFRKYIKEMDNMELVNLNSNTKGRKSTLSDLQQLTNAIDDDQNIWTDAICYVIAIKHSTKNFYISCPFCKKKVVDEQNATCISCNKYYDTAKCRYILNLNIADQYQSLWITAYDETAEKIMGIPADQFAAFNQQDIQEHIKKIRYKQFKLRLLTKNQTYNNESRKKTSIIKILDLNYAQQARRLNQKLMSLLSK